MLRKEILETLRRTGFVLCFSLLLPLIYLVNEYRLDENMPFGHYLEFGIMHLIIVLLITLAYTMFSAERRDGAEEYLRTLPLSRLKLFLVKVLPRLAVSLLFVLWYRKAYMPLTSFFFDFVPVLVLIISGFLLGISGGRNPFLTGLLLLPVVYYGMGIGDIAGHLTWMTMLSGTDSPGLLDIRLIRYCAGLAVILPTIIPALVLLPMIRKWDCRSPEKRTREMLLRLLAPSALILAVSWVSVAELIR
jgi:hypothetical protein